VTLEYSEAEADRGPEAGAAAFMFRLVCNNVIRLAHC
jgi:hypothetical protein